MCVNYYDGAIAHEYDLCVMGKSMFYIKNTKKLWRLMETVSLVKVLPWLCLSFLFLANVICNTL